ncbi:MAG: hypothetical protein ACTHK7_23005 [Aureliella sp.]
MDPDDLSSDPRAISDRAELSSEDTALLARLLLDVDSWFFARKQCLPKGTAIISLQSRAGNAELLMGMACEEWELRAANKRKGGFFDPVAGEIRDMLKRTFPSIASTDSCSLWNPDAISKLQEAASGRPNVAAPQKEPTSR